MTDGAGPTQAGTENRKGGEMKDWNVEIKGAPYGAGGEQLAANLTYQDACRRAEAAPQTADQVAVVYRVTPDGRRESNVAYTLGEAGEVVQVML